MTEEKLKKFLQNLSNHKVRSWNVTKPTGRFTSVDKWLHINRVNDGGFNLSYLFGEH